MSIADLALHQILPRVCSLCSENLRGPQERSARLCSHCLAALPGRGLPRCPRCALVHAPAAPAGASACPVELAGAFPWDAALAWADYDYPIDGWVHALKFQGEASLAEGLGWGLAEALGNAPSSLQTQILGLDAVVPLPLSRERLARRGYNQTLLIARAFIRHAGALHLDHQLLQRVRHGPALSSLPAPGRQALIRGAYQAQRGVHGLRIGLIDDVLTTGASLAEASRALKNAGAREVVVLVAARTP